MRERKAVERATLPPVPLEMIEFQSASEYACAKLLEKYTDWKGVNGATCQIKIGRTYFDFRVYDTFVEYHPVSLRREFITDGMREISSAIQSLPKSKKVEILKAVAGELEAQYAKRRGQVLSAHPVYGEMPLICVHTAEDFIRKVICRFTTKACSDVDAMRREFNKFQKSFIALRQK